uniref:Uncharacterized protein n=1 Tax=Cacopsylla melanoneura TaxID=428564 RepID=A0A8D8QZR4_9HEMI
MIMKSLMSFVPNSFQDPISYKYHTHITHKLQVPYTHKLHTSSHYTGICIMQPLFIVARHFTSKLETNTYTKQDFVSFSHIVTLETLERFIIIKHFYFPF